MHSSVPFEVLRSTAVGSAMEGVSNFLAELANKISDEPAVFVTIGVELNELQSDLEGLRGDGDSASALVVTAQSLCQCEVCNEPTIDDYETVQNILELAQLIWKKGHKDQHH